MIKSVKSRAVRRFWTKGDASGLNPRWAAKIRRQLDALEEASGPDDLTGLNRFHALTGNLAGRYAMSVSANMRLTFAFEAQDVVDIDLEDYHGK
jgi:proteic killer suppression protein